MPAMRDSLARFWLCKAAVHACLVVLLFFFLESHSLLHVRQSTHTRDAHHRVRFAMAAAFIAIRKKLSRRRKAADALRNANEMPSADPPSLSIGAGLLPPESWKGQHTVFRFYTSNVVQGTVAFIIISNFIITILEKEYDPSGVLYLSTWSTFSVLFNIIFTVELLINMAGSWFCFFWKNPWNVFDFLVVLVGLLAWGGALTGPFEDLKMLRAFRVFRLFKRIKSLNKIVTALFNAIPGVFNAFVIMLIVMCIYAILAVDAYRLEGADGTFTTETVIGRNDDGKQIITSQIVTSVTARGLRYGEEYYGTFSRALYTLFQVLTGESWAEAVARPLLFDVTRSATGPAIFFTSFILLTQIVLVNVVVAVLLDKFVTEPPQDQIPAGNSGDKTSTGSDALRSSSSIKSQVENLRLDVTKVNSQLSDVMELKRSLDTVLDGFAQGDGRSPGKADPRLQA